ncbi:hypothetical protein COOONC_19018 [Cooperia oncophora]
MDHWLRRHGYASLQKLEERLSDSESPLEFVSDVPGFGLVFDSNGVRFMISNLLIYYSFEAIIDPENKWGVEDKLSQINTLQQLENIASHGFMTKKTVDLHAMWFDIFAGEMYMFSKPRKQFVLINNETVDELEQEVERHLA